MKMGVYRTPAQKAMMAGKIIMGLVVAYLLATASFATREGGGSQGGSWEGGNGGAGAKQGMIKAEHAGATDAKPWDVESMGRNMNVLITGGAGYIGSHMALLLLDQGRYNVTIVDNLSRSFEATVKRLEKAASKAGASDLLHWRKAELYDTEAVTDILKEGHIDLVLHFAGNAYVGESVKFPELYRQNITVTTEHLVDAMLSANVPYLVYSSSCATYGNVEKLPITEMSPQKPISPYGEAKLNAEKVIKKAVEKNPGRLSAVALRYFNVVGVDQKMRTGPVLGHKAQHQYPRILDAIFDVVEGTRDKIQIAGDKFPTRDGTAVRDYVHVSDLVEAHLAAFKSLESSTFEAFNIGTGKGLTVKEIVEVVQKVTGKKVESVITDARPGDASELVSSADKLQKLTGWKPKYADVNVIVESQWKWRKHLKEEEAIGAP